MKRTLALALVLATAPAHADDFQLSAMTVKPTGTNAVGERLVEVSGNCGAAKVRFSGVRQREDGLAADETATLTLQGAKGRLVSGAGGTLVLDAANELACVATPKGPRMVLAAWCMSTQCPNVNYQVVDATSIRQLTKFDVERACDKACAEKALGAKLPKELLSY